MNTYIKFLPVAALALGLSMTSCVGDLDVTPIDPNLELEYSPEGLFNKCYANFAMQGNKAGDEVDIDGLDGGTAGLVRQMFNSNELTTDEAICGWGDQGIAEFCYNTYGDSHPMLKGYYARLTTGISYCNQYLSACGDYDATMSAEIRYLRAFQYYLILDGWGNIPFATAPLAAPEQYNSVRAYEWLVNEVNEIEPLLSTPKAKKSTDTGYGRVDQVAAWMLLARLYLNAEVYTGTAQWDNASKYANKVMTEGKQGGYKLNTQGTADWSAYQMLFMADNGESDAAYEAIFPMLQDGLQSRSWCSSLFLVASTFDADLHANKKDKEATNNTDQAWGGNRCRPDLLKKFGITDDDHLNVWDMTVKAGDDRALFDGVDRLYDNEDPGVFKNGYATTKFNNWRSDNQAAHDATFTDMDFFMLRVAEAYLTYAEAEARKSSNVATGAAADAINALRTRAHAKTQTSYTLNEILDEWSREFYFEGRRRTDLIRHGKFGGNTGFTWTWKGGTHEGRNFDAQRNVFPLPSTVVQGNRFDQNLGY